MENNVEEVSKENSLTVFQFPNPFFLIKDGAIFAYKNFWRLFVLILLPIVVIVLLEAALIFSLDHFSSNGLPDIASISQPHSLALFMLFGVLLLLVECVFIGSVISYIFKKDRGQDTGIVDSWRLGFFKCWPLFCTIFIIQLCFMTSVVLLVIPAIALMIYAMFFPFAVIVDGYKDLDAIVASYITVRGAWWRTFGYYLLVILMCFAAEIIFVFVLTIAASVLGLFGLLFPSISLIFSACMGILLIVLSIVALVFFVAIVVYYFYAYYKSLKLRKAAVFEAEFNAARPKARKFFVVLAIVGFLLIVTFYASGLYGRYVNFIQNFNENLQRQETMIHTSTASSFSPGKNLYVSQIAHFEINLPDNWAHEESTSTSSAEIDDLEQFVYQNGQSTITVSKVNMSDLRKILPSSTDDQIASGLAQQLVASVKGQLDSYGLKGFQVSDVQKQTFGPDSAYVYRGSAAEPVVAGAIADFEVITIFNKTHGYQILALWPESEYGWDAKPLMESLDTFKIND